MPNEITNSFSPNKIIMSPYFATKNAVLNIFTEIRTLHINKLSRETRSLLTKHVLCQLRIRKPPLLWGEVEQGAAKKKPILCASQRTIFMNEL